jgi:hypothetical protein
MMEILAIIDHDGDLAEEVLRLNTWRTLEQY